MKNGRKPSNLVKSHFIRLYIGSPSTTLPSSEHHWHDFVIHYYVWNKIHKSHMTIFWAGSIQMIPFLMQTFFFSYKVICVISASRFLKRSLMNGIYQNCSDVLWEKIVLVIEKTFWNSRLKADNWMSTTFEKKSSYFIPYWGFATMLHIIINSWFRNIISSDLIKKKEVGCLQ